MLSVLGLFGILFQIFTVHSYIHFDPYSTNCTEGFTHLYRPSLPKKIKLLNDCHRVSSIQLCVEGLTNKVHPQLDFINFDEFADKYAHCVAQEFGLNKELSWVDMYGKKNELQTPAHKGLHVRATVTNVEYQPLDRNIQEKPEVLLTKWLHNNQPDQEISAKISEEVEKTDVVTYSVMHGVETSLEIEWEALVSGSISAEYSFEHEKEESTKTTRKFKLEDTVTVPANSSVHVAWLLTEAQVTQQWTADIRISGWIAMKFQENGEIWFLPVGEMGHYFSGYLTKIDSLTAEFKAKGIQKAPENVDSQVSTWQFELKKDISCAKLS